MKKHTSTSKHLTDTQWADWLNTAIAFSVWKWSNKKHIIEARDFIFKDIGETYRVSKDKAKDRSMLLVFLLNLWVGFCVGSPVQISLNKNKYANNGIYGKVFFTYERTIRLLEELERRGYLQRAIGYFTEEDSRETRIWGTEKLIRLFVEEYKFQPVGDVITEYPTELVQLRNEISKEVISRRTGKKVAITKHIPVQFEDTESTLQMQKNLESYNALAQSQSVTVKLEGENFVSGKLLIKSLIEGLSSGSTRLGKVVLNHKNPVASPYYSGGADLTNSSVEKKHYSENTHSSGVTDTVEEPVVPVQVDNQCYSLVESQCYSKDINSQHSLVESKCFSRDNDLQNSSVGSEYFSGDTQVLSVFTDIPGLMITSTSYKNYRYPTIQYNYIEESTSILDVDSILSCITNTLYSQQWRASQSETAFFLYLLLMKKLFGLIKIKEKKTKLREEKRTELLNIKRKLIDFGIKNLEFEIERKSLHRVFNRGSLEFDKGGRNYGAFYQGLHEDVRSCIHINGNETTEVDFSGMHIRMLYHQLNLDYRIDPYAIGTKEERKKYKFVSLISINAAKKEAAAAIKKLLRKHNIDYGSGKGCINKLIENYKEFHEPIKEYLFTSAGIDLQNTDSMIMEEILMELHRRGIVGLPIHDSVIVEVQHKELLKELMMNAYRKFMDFEPVLKVA